MAYRKSPFKNAFPNAPQHELDESFVKKFTKQWIKNISICMMPGSWRLLKIWYEKTKEFLSLFTSRQ